MISHRVGDFFQYLRLDFPDAAEKYTSGGPRGSALSVRFRQACEFEIGGHRDDVYLLVGCGKHQVCGI